VAAIITAYNEEDIIGETIQHLARNGISVYLIDNWSTDATLEVALATEGVEWLGHERFPEAGPASSFEWTRILNRVEQVASELEVDWIVSNDADEFRYAPWAGISLRDALFHVQQQGFNAVNHSYLNFELTSDSLRAGHPVGERLRWFRAESSTSSARVNAWHHTHGTREEIAWSANHEVRFPDRAIFPYNFLVRHYPIRSVEQGQRKVFRDRLPRYPVAERLKGWHSHYDSMSLETLIKPTEGLLRFDDHFDEDFLLERLTGVGFESAPPTASLKLRVARGLKRIGLLDRALTLRWRLSGRAAR
jgi:hypothetical protein